MRRRRAPIALAIACSLSMAAPVSARTGLSSPRNAPRTSASTRAEPAQKETRASPGAALDSTSASLSDLEHDLRTARPEKRRTAVRALAEIDTRPAWNLLVGALEDREPEVADEAQLALGRAREPRLLADLVGNLGLRAREPMVRLRVAEALGRVTVALDGELLASRLSIGDPETSRALLWSIERLRRAQRLGGDASRVAREVEKLVRAAGDSRLRASALVTLAALDHFAAYPLVHEALSDRNPTLRCAALAVAGGYPEAECITLARAALRDPEPRVRCQALENLEQLSTRASILVLVDHLELEQRERLRWRMLAFLQGRSGLEHGFDAAAWRAWAGTVSSSTQTGTERRTVPLGDTRVAFAGLPMLSDRVSFLIDFSGSMWQTKVGEQTRKEIVDARLRAALSNLPEGTAFNVIPYTGEPHPWEKALVPSTRPNVARALAWFERAHQSGRGNFYDAALLALADPAVDTLVVLTDGVPTGGQRWNLELMVELLAEENRFRKVAFDAVLVDAPAGCRRHWDELARRTGGRTISATFDELAR